MFLNWNYWMVALNLTTGGHPTSFNKNCSYLSNYTVTNSSAIIGTYLLPIQNILLKNLSFHGNLTSWNCSSPSLPAQLMPFADVIQLFVMICIYLLSLTGNGLLLWTIYKKTGVGSSAGSRLLFNLAGVNLFLTITVLPWNIASIPKHGWPFFPVLVEDFCCKSTFWIFEVMTKISWVTVGMIALDRYLAIVRMTSYTNTMTNTKANFMLGFSWVQSILVSTSGLISSTDQMQYQDSRYVCALKAKGRHIFICVDLFLSFLVPSCIVFFCWGKIFLLALSKKLKVHVGVVAPLVTPGESYVTPSQSRLELGITLFLTRTNSRESISSGNSSVGNSRKSSTVFIYNKSLKALSTVCIIVGSFLFTVGIYVASLLLECFDTTGKWQPEWFLALASCAIFGSSAAYPFVYGGLNRTIRTDVKWMLRSLMCRKAVAIAAPPRRWSISSHVLDYFPTIGPSRRASVDKVLNKSNQSRRRSSAASQESTSDTVSDSSSVFHNFFKAKTERRRISAPGRLLTGQIDHLTKIAADAEHAADVLIQDIPLESAPACRGKRTGCVFTLE